MVGTDIFEPPSSPSRGIYALRCHSHSNLPSYFPEIYRIKILTKKNQQSDPTIRYFHYYFQLYVADINIFTLGIWVSQIELQEKWFVDL